MIVENCEGPHKGPAVRVQLGRSHVDLCEESQFEPREGKAESRPLENGSVHKEERLVRIHPIISAYGDSLLNKML